MTPQWHLATRKQPSKMGLYLITYRVEGTERFFCTIARWLLLGWEADIESEFRVVAWAEMPEAFDPYALVSVVHEMYLNGGVAEVRIQRRGYSHTYQAQHCPAGMRLLERLVGDTPANVDLSGLPARLTVWWDLEVLA